MFLSLYFLFPRPFSPPSTCVVLLRFRFRQIPTCKTRAADMDATKRVLIACANSLVPISIVLVGVGKGDMRQLTILDADKQALTIRGFKATRDIAQFVGEFKNRKKVNSDDLHVFCFV